MQIGDIPKQPKVILLFASMYSFTRSLQFLCLAVLVPFWYRRFGCNSRLSKNGLNWVKLKPVHCPRPAKKIGSSSVLQQRTYLSSVEHFSFKSTTKLLLEVSSSIFTIISSDKVIRDETNIEYVIQTHFDGVTVHQPDYLRGIPSYDADCLCHKPLCELYKLSALSTLHTSRRYTQCVLHACGSIQQWRAVAIASQPATGVRQTALLRHVWQQQRRAYTCISLRDKALKAPHTFLPPLRPAAIRQKRPEASCILASSDPVPTFRRLQPSSD